MNQEYQEQYFSSDEYGTGLQSILWFFVAIFFSISSISLALIIYLCANNEWDIASYYSNSVVDFAISTFPFFLLLFFLPSLFIAITFFKFTSSGKTVSLYKSFIIFTFLILFTSLLFFYTGIANKINNSLTSYKFYELIVKNRTEIWQSPDFGLLSGEIGAITDLDNFLLIDFNNKLWTIKSNSPKITDKDVIQPGNKIKLLGRKNDANIFEAKEIRPYQ